MNRRNSLRAKVDLLVNRFIDGHPYMCRMTDISPNGARLVPLLEPRNPPRYMGLQFQLPGTDIVLATAGEAMNGSPDAGATGVRFTNLAPASAQAIHHFIASAASAS